jgi:hypothetical protein
MTGPAHPNICPPRFWDFHIRVAHKADEDKTGRHAMLGQEMKVSEPVSRLIKWAGPINGMREDDEL